MPKNIELKISPDQHTELHPSYRVRLGLLKMFLSEASAELQKTGKNVEVGPSKWTETSSGLHVVLLSFRLTTSMELLKGRLVTWQVFALDTDGHIVGDRQSFLPDLPHCQSSFAIASSIATGLRNRGLARPIDELHRCLCQIEADGRNAPVCWKVTNGNLSDLEEITKDYNENPSPANSLLLQQAQAEQIRWQALYGVGGKLGFSPHLCLEFLPQAGVTDVSHHVGSSDAVLLQAIMAQM